MKRVNYDVVAPTYDRRYEGNRYDGVRSCVRSFLEGERGIDVAEVGCGTGHWLADLSDIGFGALIGIDLSAGMLERARVTAPTAMLVRGTADQMPLADACVDRVFCVNALHHFRERAAFMSECRRVLRPGGGVLTIGLDPHRGEDRWWVYDFFPAALPADRERYSSSAMIRDLLSAVGFGEITTEAAQRFPAEVPFEAARDQGLVDRRSTSQLMVISDEDFETGMGRLVAEKPMLRADLTLYATTGWI